jgi:hypothetical protein
VYKAILEEISAHRVLLGGALVGGVNDFTRAAIHPMNSWLR